MRNYKIFCPKCNDEDVEITVEQPPAKTRISMDDLPGIYGAILPAVHTVTTYKATCKNCGHSITWSS